MTRVYLADAIRDERQALRLLLLDQKMEIAGEADNWSTTLAEMPICDADMLVANWELLPARASSAALDELRRACPKALIVVLIGPLEARQQTARLIGADVYISKDVMAERVAEQLRAAAAKIRT